VACPFFFGQRVMANYKEKMGMETDHKLLEELKKMSFEEMQMAFPDQWLLIANPETEQAGLQTISGIVLAHHADKKVLCALGSGIIKEKKYSRYTLEFTGKMHTVDHYMTGIFKAHRL
jgi:hypothetical protein